MITKVLVNITKMTKSKYRCSTCKGIESLKRLCYWEKTSIVFIGWVICIKCNQLMKEYED